MDIPCPHCEEVLYSTAPLDEHGEVMGIPTDDPSLERKDGRYFMTCRHCQKQVLLVPAVSGGPSGCESRGQDMLWTSCIWIAGLFVASVGYGLLLIEWGYVDSEEQGSRLLTAAYWGFIPFSVGGVAAGVGFAFLTFGKQKISRTRTEKIRTVLWRWTWVFALAAFALLN